MRAPLLPALFLLATLGPALTAGCARTPTPSAAAVAPAPAAVLLRLRLRAGEALRSVTVMDTYLHMGPEEPAAGDSARPMAHVTEFSTESVVAVSGDTFTIAHIADSSHMTMLGVNLPMPSLDSLPTRGLMMTMRMNGRGRVLSIQIERTARIEGRMAMLRAVLPGVDSSGELGYASVTLLPELAVRVGETWADTAPCPPVARGCEGGVVTTYRLERVEQSGEHSVAVISSQTGTPAMALEQPMEITSGPTRIVGESGSTSRPGGASGIR